MGPTSWSLRSRVPVSHSCTRSVMELTSYKSTSFYVFKFSKDHTDATFELSSPQTNPVQSDIGDVEDCDNEVPLSP